MKEFTEFYTEKFKNDMTLLGVLPPSKFTKATDYIDEMVSLIEKIPQKYKAEDGSTYFNIQDFHYCRSSFKICAGTPPTTE